MILFYILLFLTIMLALHLIVLPLSKKRPIILQDFEAILFIVVLIATITFFLGIICYILSFFTLLALFFVKPWFIMGVSSDNLAIALDKAILASRSASEKLSSHYIIEGALKIHILKIGQTINVVFFKNKAYSKKASLTISIWRKFIQNYFI